MSEEYYKIHIEVGLKNGQIFKAIKKAKRYIGDEETDVDYHLKGYREYLSSTSNKFAFLRCDVENIEYSINTEEIMYVQLKQGK
ncbi:hypothetical protein UP17_16360 [Peribacillus simplex]|uniref:hypothetical protein n=1 Tax=Peribacillus simplex TaxID=1478 RepID=UPI000777F125|nr:hypothetical protein [Peribacillus simplex]AMM93854.1 hypothetical protein UP17_16360 [Peribacillus simplex]